LIASRARTAKDTSLQESEENERENEVTSHMSGHESLLNPSQLLKIRITLYVSAADHD